MKTICLLIHDDAGQESRLQAALDLTRILDGHLTCIDVAMLPLIVDNGFGGVGIGQGMLLADECAREADNKARLEARLAHEDVSWNWVDTTGDAAQAIIDTARLADLVVLNRKLDGFPVPDMHDIASRVLMHARKPVVAVPDDLDRFEHGRAMIAWDGSASATATMHACLPLLQRASEVNLFMARDPRRDLSADDAAVQLSRHGVHAIISYAEDSGVEPVYHLIEAEAKSWHADYIVMGAYGHGRLRETFGGVTKSMLASSTLPVILGH